MVAAYNLPFPEPATGTPIDIRTVRADNLSAARRAARERARRHGLSIDQVVDVELAITELLSNSITHGGGSGVARIWSDGEDLVCEVRDRGHLTDPLAGRLPAGALQGSGRGLLLVNQIADLVRVHASADGTTIRAYFRRRPTPTSA
jgi:anti-sigma regulatory factor (Ser/Thr protein kinase)